MGDFFQSPLQEWEKTLEAIFSGKIPDSRIWTENQDLVRTLYFLGRNPELNLTCLPDGGCFHLKRGEISGEKDCLDLHFVDHQICIVKPKFLEFQAHPSKPEGSYFRLETEVLAPTGWYPEVKGIREELLETAPGDYADRKYWELGSYDYDETGREVPLSSTARLVFRYFSGTFEIVMSGFPNRNLDEA